MNPIDDPRHRLVAPRVRKLPRSRGQVLALFALSIFILTGVTALVIDVSWYWANTLRVQRAADAAALAGAVRLPGDVGGAYSLAYHEAQKNGYANGVSGVVVTPVQEHPNTRRLDVTVSAPVNTFFMRIFGIKTINATRTAKGEFVMPVPMGSPEDYYGIDKLRSDANPGGVSVTRMTDGSALDPKGFWGAVMSSGGQHSNGDAYSPKYNGGSGGTNPSADYLSTGYDYTVEVGASATNGRVWIYDPGYCALGHGTATLVSGQMLGVGDHWINAAPNTAANPVTTYYNLYNTNSTPYDASDDTFVTGSGTLFANQKGIDRSPAFSGNQIYGDNSGTDTAAWTKEPSNVFTAQISGNPAAGATAISLQSISGTIASDGSELIMIDTNLNREFVRIVAKPSTYTIAPKLALAHSAGAQVWEVLGNTLKVQANAGTNQLTMNNVADYSVGSWVILDPQYDTAVASPLRGAREMFQVTAVNTTTKVLTLNGSLAYTHAVDAPVPVDTSALKGYRDCSRDAYHNAWWQLASGLAPGRYRLQVTTNDPVSDLTALENMWGVEVAPKGASAASSTRVYGTGSMAAYNNLLGDGAGGTATQQFYLAQVGAENAGKTMEIDLFDPGDVGGNAYLKIRSPDGNAYNYTTFSYSSDSNCVAGTSDACSASGRTQIQTAKNGASSYQNTWVTVLIPLGSNYGCATSSPGTPCLKPSGENESGWWKIEYQVGLSSDTTTWRVSIRGNPVHLVVP